MMHDRMAPTLISQTIYDGQLLSSFLYIHHSSLLMYLKGVC
jgi:hypothetical protein